MNLHPGDMRLRSSPKAPIYPADVPADNLKKLAGLARLQCPSTDRLNQFARILETVRSGVAWHHEIADRMQRIEIHPALIHAYWHTGIVLRAETFAQATTEELVGWHVAIDGWERESRVTAPERRWFSEEEYWSVTP